MKASVNIHNSLTNYKQAVGHISLILKVPNKLKSQREKTPFLWQSSPCVLNHELGNRHVSISKYIHIYIYIYKYIHISAIALCAFGVTELKTLLSHFCSPTLCLQDIIVHPQIRTGVGSRRSSPPWAAFEKHCFCYMSLLIFTISF